MSLLARVKSFFRRLFALGPTRPLCDTCKYDYGNICSRPERPNAMKCPDYKRR